MTCEELTSAEVGAIASGMVRGLGCRSRSQWAGELDHGAPGKKVLVSTMEAGEGAEGGAGMGRGCWGPGRVLSESPLGRQALAEGLRTPLWFG